MEEFQKKSNPLWLLSITISSNSVCYVPFYIGTVELPFAVAFDSDPGVKLYFKIPDKFKIETPIGTYNPDWAAYLNKDGLEKLYFVLETKGVSGQIGMEGLATAQRQKINCGAKHFRALESGVDFPEYPVRSWTEFKSRV